MTAAGRVGDELAGLEDRFDSPVRSERTAALLGIGLAVSFTICFLTGLYSHLLQNEPGWLTLPSRPAGLYRVTQGLHVTTGIATIPLLLAKLWTVGPRFFTWPPVRSVAHAVERVFLLPLVGGSIFLLVSGSANVARWYPWSFFFPTAHYWVAWITIGALIVHVGAKMATTRTALRREQAAGPDAAERRWFLAGVGAAAAAFAVSTAGGTVRALSPISSLAQRRAGDGPQGIPINKSARQAVVLDVIEADDFEQTYELVVDGAVERPLRLDLAALRAMPQREATLPIACVEGWSASGRWRGIAVRDLLAEAGAADGATVVVESIQPRGLYRRSELNPRHAADRDTLLALELEGQPLHRDHGYPLRLIGPNRPGVMQTKWVNRLVVR